MKGHETMKVYEYKISLVSMDIKLKEYEVQHLETIGSAYCALFCTDGNIKMINNVDLISITCLYKLSPIKLEKANSYMTKLFTQLKASLQLL